MWTAAQQSMPYRPRLHRGRVRVPSAEIEYAYYFAVTYSIAAPAVGLEIPGVAGALLFAVWLLCFCRVQPTAKEVFAPIALLVCCGISFILIQIGIHDESLLDSSIRAFVTWILGLMIVQSLLLRPGFSVRFPIVLFAIGVVMLPFIGFNPAGDVEMARVDIAVQGGLTHPAGFAEWFGFCAAFFAVFGTQTRDLVLRTVVWGLMVACLFLVTLSVERGPLFETALALILAFRKQLKRGFLPLFVLTMFVGIISFTGIFERASSNYLERGFEDTGREVLWPEAIDRIQAAPFFGEGLSNAVIQLSAKQSVPPHNIFLYFALSSGLVPLLLFAAFWIRVSWRNVIQRSARFIDPFALPFLAFIWPSLMLGDTGFASISALLITSIVANASMPRRPQFADVSFVRARLAGRRRFYSRPIATRPKVRPVYGPNSRRPVFK